MSTKKDEPQVPATRDIFKGHENHNKLLPTETYFQNVGPMQRVSIETVHISPDPMEGDVYKLEDGKYPLTKRGLEKIAHAAGISFHPEYSRIEEHRGNYCRYKAVGAMRKADGTLQIVTGTYFIDLEADKKGGMSEKRLKARRQYIVQLCESGAKNRAIRSLLGLKSNYKTDELKNPFAVPRIDFSPDLSDPTVKQFLLQQATQATTALYPPTSQAIEAEHRMIENGEPEPEPSIDDAIAPVADDPELKKEARMNELSSMEIAELRDYFIKLVKEKGYPHKDDPADVVSMWNTKDRTKQYEAIYMLEEWGGEDA